MWSIVVPTYDRETALTACLDALAATALPAGAAEVIVVDDGSPRPVADVVAAFAPRLPLRTCRQRNAGPAAARNAGARDARGDRLVFLDDDCLVDRTWWTRLVAHCRRHPAAMIGGGTQNGLADDPYAACHHLLYDYLSRRSNGRPHAATFCTSNNLAVPTAGFVELGGFDETFPFAAGEDRDFCDRWRASGRAIVHAPDVVVHHAHPMTLRSFWRQHFRYGRGARRLHERRFARGAGGIALQRPSFYLGLLAFPFREVAPSSLPACMSLLLVSQVATAGGYVVERFVGSRPAHAAR